MKKETFHIGDKVFAKVKGYPPWPAIILEENGKKFKVKFYGTGEIGQIKSEDLFYYTRHKSKLLKPSKRKDFHESVKEIEEAIAQAGTDGDPHYGIEKSNESVLSDASSIIDSESSFSKKRKRSLSVVKSAEESPLNKAKKGKLASNRSSNQSPFDVDNDCEIVESKLSEPKKPTDPVAVEKEDKTEEHQETTDSSEIAGKKVDEVKVENDILYEETLEEHSGNVDKPGYEDFVLEKELEAYIAYGNYVEKRKEIYLKMPVEKRNCSKLQVLPMFIEDKCIGLKLHENWPLDTFDNEYGRSVYDKQISERVLKLKKSLNVNNLKKSPDMYYENLETSEGELKLFWDKELTRIREEILEKLKIESRLLEIDSKIKSCLNLDKADPKEAILLLDKMLNLDIIPVMLMKHAHVVDMVRRLKKYVGNLESWNLSEEETAIFRRDAEKVRGSALKLHVKFMKIIGKPQSNESFWDHFNEIATKFREDTKDLDEMEFYLLNSWPYSRDNFLKNFFIKDISSTLTTQIDTIVGKNV